jgi:hypothetical protein
MFSHYYYGRDDEIEQPFFLVRSVCFCVRNTRACCFVLGMMLMVDSLALVRALTWPPFTVFFCYLDLHDQHSKTNMLTFISFFLASLANMIMMMPGVDAAGGGAFAVKPHFAKDDILVNQRKGFVGCGENDNDGRKTGEAFLSRQVMDKIREAVGLPPLGGGAAHTGGATVQATLISKTTRMHSDSHWDKERTPMSAHERTGFVVLSDDHDAYFSHGDTMVPLAQGSLVTFEGSVEHNTIVKFGNVLLAGPFDLTTFENVGDPCSNDGKVIGDGTDGTIAEDDCREETVCTICYVFEEEGQGRRRKLDDSPTTTATTGSTTTPDRQLGLLNKCPPTVNRVCSNRFTFDMTNQPGFACDCGAPNGSTCSKNADCCSDDCCNGECLRSGTACIRS